jgi:hypothetical protein
LLLAELLVSVTLPPLQKLVGPDAEMAGVGGIGSTWTAVVSETAEQPLPFVKTTE